MESIMVGALIFIVAVLMLAIIALVRALLQAHAEVLTLEDSHDQQGKYISKLEDDCKEQHRELCIYRECAVTAATFQFRQMQDIELPYFMDVPPISGGLLHAMQSKQRERRDMQNELNAMAIPMFKDIALTFGKTMTETEQAYKDAKIELLKKVYSNG